jgi:hypothetical protein
LNEGWGVKLAGFKGGEFRVHVGEEGCDDSLLFGAVEAMAF